MSYTDAYFTKRETWRDWRIEAQQLICLARVTRGTRVLEIGCGGGGLLRMLRARGASGVGVDTLWSAVELAQNQLDADQRGQALMKKNFPRSSALVRVPLIQIDESSLPCRDNACDAIIGQHVIEHIANVDSALREWARVLKSGGRIALATPNARYPDPAHFADADHARIFAPRELSDTLAHAGFSVEACFTIFPFLTRWRALRAFGVIAHRVFQHAPYYSSRGRTIMLSASKRLANDP